MFREAAVVLIVIFSLMIYMLAAAPLHDIATYGDEMMPEGSTYDNGTISLTQAVVWIGVPLIAGGGIFVWFLTRAFRIELFRGVR